MTPSLIKIGGRSDSAFGVFVHGFLAQSEDPSSYGPWADGLLGASYPGTVFAYTWPSGKPQSLGGKLLPSITRAVYTGWLLSAALAGAQFWAKVADSAEEHGGALAQHVLAEARGRPVDLFAHSLGSAVVMEAARVLARVGNPARSVCVCGAAVEKSADWVETAASVDRALVNVFSTNDKVLMLAFRGGQVLSGRGSGNAIGRAALKDSESTNETAKHEILNLDASAFVANHFSYADFLPAVLSPYAGKLWGLGGGSPRKEARASLRQARMESRAKRKSWRTGEGDS